MRFVILRKADGDTEAGATPTEDLIVAMGRYNQELADAGALVTGEGLRRSTEGARIRFSRGKPTIIDGPFSETKELVAGFTIIDVSSKEDAIAWAKRWPPMDGNGEVELELRRVYELEEFPQGEGTKLHADLGAKLARRPTMMNPYVVYDGRCKEAFEFYADCLDGRIEFLMTHGESPMATDIPIEWHGKVLHASLRVGQWVLMGSDRPSDDYQPPTGFAVQLSIPKADHAEFVFRRLSEDGTVQMPLAETFWAHRFGMCVDRFRIPWMINCEKAD